MQIIQELQSFLDNIKSIGGDARELRVDPPATEEEISRVERELGVAIPAGLRSTMLQVSAHLECCWFLKDAIKLPQELDEIFSGEIGWGLDLMAGHLEGYQGWIKEAFSNPEDPYDAVWHDKFPFQEVGNGDYLAIDPEGKVVYLSHEGDESHGYVLAESFTDLLARWVPLGCPGGEDWQWLPFTNGRTTAIDPNCENALQWKTLIKRK